MRKFVSCIAIAVLFVSAVFLCCCGGTKYVVTFEYDDGSVYLTELVEAGKTVDKPRNPGKLSKGQVQYEFINWFYGDEPFDFDTPINGDIKIKAKFKEVPFTPSYPPDETAYFITIDYQNGSSADVQRVVAGRKVTKPADPVKNEDEEGVYTFDCWYLGNAPYDFSTPVTRSFVLTAHYNVTLKYTVTFDTKGGSVINPVRVLSGNKVKKPDNPIKPDDARYSYTFSEWRLNGVAFDFETPITGNITLVAEYKAEMAYTPDYPPDVL